MKKLVTIGGGTGHYSLLRGLKNRDLDLAAVVSVADDGGSTGELRTDFGILAPGDLRNCLVALSDETEIEDIARLFEYRFPQRSRRLGDHNVGNIILAALTHLCGNMANAVQVASKILKTKGKVLPVSLDASHLYARTESGKLLKGQLQVSYPARGERIAQVWLKPAANAYRDSVSAIREADLIVICPGDLYGSVIPNFLTKGIREAIGAGRGRLAYVCNLVTKQGTYGFSASDFVREIVRYCGRKPDFVVYNTKRPTRTVVDKYRKEASSFVAPDAARLKSLAGKAVPGALLVEHDSGDKRIVRHDSEKTARLIMELL
ncbi:MAG: YvcK family protein [Elusimicrobia bacterium]|nr:YvcK family protein [Elusimicrobiota bacterium]